MSTYEQPLARVPFEIDDEKTIASMAKWMMFIAVVHFIISFLILIGSCFAGFGVAMAPTATGVGGSPAAVAIGAMITMLVFMVLTFIVLLVQGVLLAKASSSFKAVATTDHADQDHLAAGFRRMRVFFLFEVIFGLLTLARSVWLIVNLVV